MREVGFECKKNRIQNPSIEFIYASIQIIGTWMFKTKFYVHYGIPTLFPPRS
jgi:hypothetical protein